MARDRLTVKMIEAIVGTGEEYFIWDKSQAGLGIRVNEEGICYFVVRFSVKGGPRRKVFLGKYGTVTLDEARLRARRMVSAALDGKDIIEQRQADADRMTLKELSEAWIEKRVRLLRKPRTAKDYGLVFKRYLLKKFGKRIAETITRAEITKHHASMRGTPKAANDMLAVGKACFNYGLKAGLIGKGADNPFAGVDMYPMKGRERFLSLDELNRVSEAIIALEVEGELSTWAAAALRLLMLTGARSGEIKSLRWAHVDLERGLLNLPDSKTGAKVIHLSEPAKEILRGLARVKDNPFVIVGQKPKTHMVSLRVPWERVCKKAKIESCRVHDLRHTYASLLAGAGVPLFTIGKLLGHTVPATTQRYAHLARDALQRANDQVGEQLKGLANSTGGNKDDSA